MDAPVLPEVSLADKYRLERGRVYLTGVQALARLPMLQHARDRAAGLNTAGYVTGYRGSPLAGLDSALHQAAPHLAEHHIRFQPGVNEDLAATACWGTQQLHLLPDAQRDGVFAMWYGKGPGVDRCVDVFKHANHAGTAPHGGVLVVAGDDHGARSSAVAHQSEHVFSACAMPVLAPANVQDLLDFGLHGWAMSRYAGVWVAMKTSADTVESSTVVELDPQRVQPVLPTDFVLPADGVHLRLPDPQAAQERRMQAYKIYAAAAYARANGIDRLVIDPPDARLGIVACGKAWGDLRQALVLLGIGDAEAAALGLRLYKVGMPWPLEAEGARRFARGLQEILVVEEKRQIIEYQLKEMLYERHDGERPRVVGKFDEGGEWPAPHGQWLLPPTGELDAAIVARAIALRLARLDGSTRWRAAAAALDTREAALAGLPAPLLQRTPYFCSGCPHNRSTRVPEGSSALAGVGCHLMAAWMDRGTLTISQMGGEGVAWLGLSGHAGTRHVFANMGDGTYFHSGLLAIRAAVAAEVAITYKILYNDAVAMTGGQPLDGQLSVPQLTRQLAAEGVRRIVVLADDLGKYPRDAGFAAGVELRPRTALDAVQRELRELPGVTALIYDQTCATELRRRRKRGELPESTTHVFINEALCEGCGDCAVKSNCLSVVPVATEFGTKRAIDGFSCNQDLSCLEGCCPALVSVEGNRRQHTAPAGGVDESALPQPLLPPLDTPWSLLVAGVGGTGVVTIGALLGMAAHLDGLGVTVLDVTGLAQKGGAVLSHVRIARDADTLHAVRIAPGDADALLGGDLLVAAAPDTLRRLRRDGGRAIVNTAQTITGDFLRDPDLQMPSDATLARLQATLGKAAVEALDATRLATLLLGHPVATNMFMLGLAWQRGLVPVSRQALLRAVQLNGVAVDENQRAFAWGRQAACDPVATAAAAAALEQLPAARRLSTSLDERIERRCAALVAYQGRTGARDYAALLVRVRAAEQRACPGSERLADAVAHQAWRLIAHKDVYEAARLHTDRSFHDLLDQAFDGGYRMHWHLAPPGLSRTDPLSGEPHKRRYGPWMRPLLATLAHARFVRGTPFDPFGYSEEARLARSLRDDYLAAIEAVLAGLDAKGIDAAVAIAELPARVRGFGPIWLREARAAHARLATLRGAASGSAAAPPTHRPQPAPE
ncbi:MAG: indolepyruvate ferredoxin oxidoreductase family protein [Rubrivivax sp.]|nr:indolepyruvate ferredoxin oxidoreductase family protein [Rubrivivax sp.]